MTGLWSNRPVPHSSRRRRRCGSACRQESRGRALQSAARVCGPTVLRVRGRCGRQRTLMVVGPLSSSSRAIISLESSFFNVGWRRAEPKNELPTEIIALELLERGGPWSRSTGMPLGNCEKFWRGMLLSVLGEPSRDCSNRSTSYSPGLVAGPARTRPTPSSWESHPRLFTGFPLGLPTTPPTYSPRSTS